MGLRWAQAWSWHGHGEVHEGGRVVAGGLSLTFRSSTVNRLLTHQVVVTLILDRLARCLPMMIHK